MLTGRPLSPRGLDECIKCHKTVEEDCIRLGLFERWHAPCLKCGDCERIASVWEDVQGPSSVEGDPRPPKRRALPRPEGFTYIASNVVSPNAINVGQVYCPDHSKRDSVVGFESVSRLEQFAFLLNVALRRLSDHLRQNGVISTPTTGQYKPFGSNLVRFEQSLNLVPLLTETPLMSDSAADANANLYDVHRDSTDFKKLKSVNLDRKLSATARMPKRSTIVESPSGKTAKGVDTGTETPPTIDGQLHAMTASNTAAPKPERLTPPVPTHVSGASHEVILIDPQDESSDSSRLDILRPAFGRANTHVAIVSSNSHDTIGDAGTSKISQEADTDESPFEHEQGVTLADIPAFVEAEQAKLEHRPPPSSEGRPLISELSALDATIVKHFALIALTKTSIAHYIEMEELLELVEIRKNQWWNKLFKPGKDKKDVKRKGVFGVPLEILVEKTGSDSQLGATNAQLRVPEFIDNVVSAMKQMGKTVHVCGRVVAIVWLIMLLVVFRHVH